MIGLRAIEIRYVNSKLATLTCPTHNKKTIVNLKLKEINYSKCCEAGYSGRLDHAVP